MKFDLNKFVPQYFKDASVVSEEGVKGIEHIRKIRELEDVRVIYLDDSGLLHGLTKDDEIRASLNISKGMMRIPQLNRIFFVRDSVYRDKKNNKFVFLSQGYHASLNLDELDGYRVKNGVIFDSKGNKVKELELKDGHKIPVEAAINLKQFNNNLSIELSVLSDDIMSTDSFRYLDDVPNRTIIFSFILGGFVFTTLIGSGLLFLFALGEVIRYVS